MTTKRRGGKAKRAKETRAAYAPRVAKTVTIHQAKTHLSRLIRGLAAGDVVIARGKTPVAKLVAYPAALPKRRFGSMKGQFKFDESFFDPLPKEELDAWNT
jgi:antitoxin (DNA-binding transcriptional repressor) of toxin-antitoxin stability system